MQNDKILIVDDSATARALFKACIRGSRFKVFETDNSDEALNIAKSEEPFLIILDYNMPDKNGAEIAQLMLDNGIEAHFVLMSANTQNSVVEEVKALGFVDVLEKPITAEAVQTLLEKLS